MCARNMRAATGLPNQEKSPDITATKYRFHPEYAQKDMHAGLYQL
jgi:hypothetical protein